MGMIEKVTSAINIKEDIRDAITAKGVDMTTVTFGGFAEKIGEIETGIDPTDANAVRSDVRLGKTFYAGNSARKSGLMPDATVTQRGGVTSVTSGYLSSELVISGGGNYTATEVELENVSSGMHAQYVKLTSGEVWVNATGFVNELRMSGGTVHIAGVANTPYISEGGTLEVNGGYVNIPYISDGGTLEVNGGYAEDVRIGDGGLLVVKSNSLAQRVRATDSIPYAEELVVSAGGTATVIVEEPIGASTPVPVQDGTVTYIVNISDADATPADVAQGKTFYSNNNPIKQVGTMAGSGMPPIPSTFTSLNLNQSYTAPSDGWIRYTIRYNWGMGQNSYLDVGTRSYRFANVQGEDMDIGYITLTGIAPVYAGETFKLTAQGSTSASSVLEVAYI